MPIGMTNVGNTCYLNTFLQCLCSLTSVRSFLMNHNVFKVAPSREALVEMCPVTRITYKLIGLLDTKTEVGGGGGGGVVRSELIQKYIKQLSKHTPDYMSLHYGQQHDIGELWCWWMERIHDEFQKIAGVAGARTGAGADAWVSSHPFHQMCYTQWKQFHKKVTSFDWIWLYEGLLVHQVQCMKCRKCYHNPEPVSCLALDIPEPNPSGSSEVTLSDCFRQYFSTETLKEWTCDDCNQKTPAEKLVRFWKAADVLVIVLKRFVYNETRAYKNKTVVDFPMDFHFLEDTELHPKRVGAAGAAGAAAPNSYRLVAIANHYGGLSGGHYNATVFREGGWWHIDDDEVKPLDSTTPWWKHNNTAYILFYEKG